MAEHVFHSLDGGPQEVIVIPLARARWWALVFALPLPLAFSHAFLDGVRPLPEVPRMTDSWCGTQYFTEKAVYDMAVHEQHALQYAIGALAFVGLAIALTTFLRAKTTVVVDRDARILHV